MAIIVELNLTGAKKVLSGLEKIAKQVDELDKKFKNLGAGTGRGFGGGGAGSGGGSPRPPKAPPIIPPPIPGVPSWLQNLITPKNGANPKASPMSNFMKAPLGGLIGTTRLNLGFASPLVGRLMGFLEPLLGKFGWVGLAIIGGLKLLSMAVSEAIKTISSYRALQDSTGARGSLATGGLVAGTMGMSPDQLSGSVERFIDAISQGGIAEGRAGQLGLRSRHDSQGRSSQDDLKLYVDAIDKLRSLSYDQARSTARLWKSPEMMIGRDMSDQVWQQLKAQASTNTGATKDDRTTVANLSAAWTMLTSKFSEFARIVGTPVMKIATLAMRGLVNAMTALQPIIKLSTAPITMLADALTWLMDSIQKAWSGLYDRLPKWLKNAIDMVFGGDNKDDNDKAVDANVRALNDNTRALNNAREVMGGGNRAKGAIPAAWRFNMASENHFREATRLGAF